MNLTALKNELASATKEWEGGGNPAAHAQIARIQGQIEQMTEEALKHGNREVWLNAAVPILAELIAGTGATVPENVKVSCSWPSRAIRKTIGQAWSAAASKSGVHETCISPVLDDAVRVLDVLTHELIHHAVGVDAGHKAPFRRVALAVGLEGKMTATVAGEELRARLNEIADGLGPYPHGRVDPGVGQKKQGTRMIKCQCPDCGYTARTTAKWLELSGPPICPCNNEPMEVCS